MSDSISRKAAIDMIMGQPPEPHYPSWYAEQIKGLSPAQSERLTDDDFETIRIHLSAYKERLCNQWRWDEAEEYQRIIDRFMSFVSAQPDTDRIWEALSKVYNMDGVPDEAKSIVGDVMLELDEPSAQPERKKMSNKEWVDFLSEQFGVSRTSAREMLHGLMKWKAEDNFKKQFSGGRNEKG